MSALTAGARDPRVSARQQRGRAEQPAPGAVAAATLVAGQRRPGDESTLKNAVSGSNVTCNSLVG